jgi:hypothetical protein
MSENDIHQIHTKVSDVQTTMTEMVYEVKGINRRLDISNGRIAKMEEKVIELDKDNVRRLTEESRHDEEMVRFVTQDQFWPVKAAVYGFISISLAAVIVGLITLVIK